MHKHQDPTRMSSYPSNLEKLRIPWGEILIATDNFSPENNIGNGGFGTVYKGELSIDQKKRKVAIKCLTKKGERENNEFRKELEMVFSFNHKNIIPCIGYSDNADEIVIVYEFASNSSLDFHLKNAEKRHCITWSQRMKICLGVARGLEYLHSGLGDKRRVIHRDLKSANILLDDKMKAKIGDFGLSIFGPRNQPQTTIFTNPAGTMNYIDPLYWESGIISKESDIYSFGVVMFEMLTGMMAYQVRSIADGKEAPLMGLVRRYYKISPDKLKDNQIKGNIDSRAFNKFKKVAFECVSIDKNNRPTADKIVRRIKEALCFQKQMASHLQMQILPIEDVHTCLGPLTEDQSEYRMMSKADMKIRRILEIYPHLGSYKDHVEYRIKRFEEWHKLFDLDEGGLTEFSKGYLKFGFNREKEFIVYREWAQAAKEAQLVVFNGRDGSYHEMIKDKFGVWSVEIPNNDNGDSVLTHNSRVKFRFKHNNGDWIYRVPAWINYTRPTAPCNGVYWDPYSERDNDMKFDRPAKPEAPHIYIAHFGKHSSGFGVYSYREFADNILPGEANKYNTVQLMGVMEHSSYGPLGYDVTNFFAVNSSSGSPEDLKYLIDEAHRLGLRVLLDVVHSHVSSNITQGLSGFDVGQATEDSYFHTGERGYHRLWRSRLFNYSNWEVLRFLLSNLRWWLEEFMFDGFRFQGVTSMLYDHHGIEHPFTGNYDEYFSNSIDVDAVVYMMLANELIHSILPDATVIAEDVSGMPGLCVPLDSGGIGFDLLED
ncbi:hypothetical protein Lser_V15G03253 [Lactuca serriola]